MVDKAARKDIPTTHDRIGREEFINHLFNHIRNSEPPLTVAVGGDWGSGKTSTLLQLRDKLEKVPKNEDREYVTIWFEAWRYQNETTPMIPLLNEMSTQLATSDKVVKKFMGEGLALLRALTFEMNLWGAKMKYSGESHHQATEEMKGLTPTEITRKALEKTINSILKGNQPRAKQCHLVLFIDDLDRCEPAMIKSLLESIKIFLDIDGAHIVLAINDHRLPAAFKEDRKKEGIEESALSEALAREYLNKITSEIWRLPIPTCSQDFLCEIVKNETDKMHETLREFARQICLEATTQKILADNPRQLKRFGLTVSRTMRTRGDDIKASFSSFSNSQNGATFEDWMKGDGQRIVQGYTAAIYLYQFFPRLYESSMVNNFLPVLADVLKVPATLKDQAEMYPVLKTITLGDHPEPSAPEYFRARSIVLQLVSYGFSSLRDYSIT